MEQTVNIKALKSSTFKVISISGEAGDRLKKHRVNTNALLVLNRGSIIYREEDRQQQVSTGEILDIPAEVFHEVVCTEDTEFLVIMPQDTKMKFAR